MNTNVMFSSKTDLWETPQNGKIEFLRGRLKFGGCDNSAPFPSMIVTFKADAKEGDRKHVKRH